MLSEIKHVRQIHGEGHRRWFSDKFFDLIIWYNDDGEIEGFQLCYDKGENERAVTWHKDSGFAHTGVDDGEDKIRLYKMTPILVSDGVFDNKKIAKKFREESTEIDSNISAFVFDKLIMYQQL